MISDCNVVENNCVYIFISGEGVNTVQNAENVIVQIANTCDTRPDLF